MTWKPNVSMVSLKEIKRRIEDIRQAAGNELDSMETPHVLEDTLYLEQLLAVQERRESWQLLLLKQKRLSLNAITLKED